MSDCDCVFFCVSVSHGLCSSLSMSLCFYAPVFYVFAWNLVTVSAWCISAAALAELYHSGTDR